MTDLFLLEGEGSELPAPTLADPMTIQAWFAIHQEWINSNTLDVVVVRFCNEFGLPLVNKADLRRLSPSKSARQVCQLLLNKKR